MKQILYVGAAAAAFALAAFTIAPSETSEPKMLEIGTKAPKTDLKMADVSGKEITLQSAAGKNGLLVIFSCNTCPFVVGNGSKSAGWEGRYPEVADMAQAKGINTVMVNSNEAKRAGGDSMADMKKRYSEKGLKGYYALDAKSQLADAFGAMTTPHVFLFDKDMKLIYKGAIDDAVDSPADVKTPYLKNAIEAYSNGKAIEPNSTRQVGCSIKRVKV